MDIDRMRDNLIFGLDRAPEIKNPTGEFEVARLSMLDDNDVPDTMNIGYRVISADKTVNGKSYIQMCVFADGFFKPEADPFDDSARCQELRATPSSYRHMESPVTEEIYDYIQFCMNNYSGINWPVNVVEVVPMSEGDFYDEVVRVVGEGKISTEHLDEVFNGNRTLATISKALVKENPGKTQEEFKAWLIEMGGSNATNSVKSANQICQALCRDFGYTPKKVTFWDSDGMPYHSWGITYWFCEDNVPFAWVFSYTSGWYNFHIKRITLDQFMSCTQTGAKEYSPGHSYTYFEAFNPLMPDSYYKKNHKSKQAQLSRYNETVVWTDKIMRKIFGTWKIGLDD